jgi:hypothetical protein
LNAGLFKSGFLSSPACGRVTSIREGNMINRSAHPRASTALFVFAVCSLGMSLVPIQNVLAQDKNAAEVRSAIKSIWDKPGALVEVDPVSVVGNHAIAGWTQEKRGGRALLRRDHGKWTVIVCGGDGLAKAAGLRQTGMSTADASSMEKAVAKAEAGVPEARRRMFALFEGTVRVESGGSHATHGAQAGHDGHAAKK